MLNNKQRAPKAKFLLPKMSPPSLLLNEDDDCPDEKELSIPEMNLSIDDSIFGDEDEDYKATKIISILKCCKDNINVNEKPRNDNSLFYNGRNSPNSIETSSSDKDLIKSELK